MIFALMLPAAAARTWAARSATEIRPPNCYPKSRGTTVCRRVLRTETRRKSGKMIEYNTLSLAVEGYPSRLSYRPGEEVAFHCTARTRTFSVEIARIGALREPVWRREGIAGAEQAVPDEAFARGCGWPVTFALTIPDTWRPGFYEVALKGDGQGGPEATSHAFFVLRAAKPGRDTRDAPRPRHQHLQRLQQVGRGLPLHRLGPGLLPAAARARLRRQADRSRRLRRPGGQHHARSGSGSSALSSLSR